ncbi:YbhB/YbcL family Raf kinase inhibitor-like protein [Chlorogloeopsis sp. ULAP01]|uniref:YbhB/YbcL family Raf kinase inhibitor-like protein n=1 Tax=Chlorogloeopsis sp. ULAP01 TaxID=3056483 RepID=UPI0025AB230A|nr:YbhB/YbcL family Raf kinase inhibitor-like protein [Chlorogloeopsis sp. ULAP01]MDM9385129.1 YbhB/YbcL family Raf kinase inhibitor-like protein [Chlorogloeopsis sp. ULAP01]
MMKRRVFFQQSVSIFVLVNLSAVSWAATDSGDTLVMPTGRSDRSKREVQNMKLASSVLEENDFIPAKYTCDGADISPALSWDEPPPETESFALIVDDPDAPKRTFVHWVVYDIPAKARQLSEQIATVKTLPNGGVQGKNDFGNLGYGGPCPPSGTHRYFFKLYALDKKLGLQPGATKNQIEAAMDGHILATAELVGRYQRQR